MSKLQDNVATAQSYLARFRDCGVANRISGEDQPVADGPTFETISPVDLKPLARVSRGGTAEIDAAAKAAQAAFPEWAARPGEARKKRSHKIADAIVARAEEIAFLECMDTGQALKFMSKAALRGAENFRFFADRAPQARDGKALRAEGQLNVTTCVPIGPVGIITPWNTPFMLSIWKIAPALAAGCTIVHKPAEFSPLTAGLLVEIAEEAGLLVNGFGEDAGKALTEHPLIRAIGFDPQTVVGPLIHPVHGKKVLDNIEIGKSEGATVAAGGEKFDGPGGGCYVTPTLFTGVNNAMRIAQEEIFGPVLTAIPFRDEAETLALANDVQYGLTGYLWTADLTRAFRFTEHLEATAFWVPTPLNIIDLLDLMATTGWVGNIERGPGRHGISHAFFLYILDPDGHRIEIYCSDYQTVDPDLEPIEWDLKDPQRQTLWGAPAPRSWFEHGSMFAGTPPRAAALAAQPIIAP